MERWFLAIREQIELAIGPEAFSRPTFYSNPGGLRFELSDSGAAVEQFLTALRKSSEVCREIFDSDQTFTVCLSVYLYRSNYSYRDTLRSLARAGIEVPRDKSMWLVMEDDSREDDPLRVLCVAFTVARALLDCILWCALGTDLGFGPVPASGRCTCLA